jgi:hypothetical protein
VSCLHSGVFKGAKASARDVQATVYSLLQQCCHRTMVMTPRHQLFGASLIVALLLANSAGGFPCIYELYVYSGQRSCNHACAIWWKQNITDPVVKHILGCKYDDAKKTVFIAALSNCACNSWHFYRPTGFWQMPSWQANLDIE